MTISLAVLEYQLWEHFFSYLRQKREVKYMFFLDDGINECRAGNVDVVFKDVSATN